MGKLQIFIIPIPTPQPWGRVYCSRGGWVLSGNPSRFVIERRAITEICTPRGKMGKTQNQLGSALTKPNQIHLTLQPKPLPSIPHPMLRSSSSCDFDHTIPASMIPSWRLFLFIVFKPIKMSSSISCNHRSQESIKYLCFPLFNLLRLLYLLPLLLHYSSQIRAMSKVSDKYPHSATFTAFCFLLGNHSQSPQVGGIRCDLEISNNLA